MSKTKTTFKQKIKRLLLITISILCFSWYVTNRTVYFYEGFLERVGSTCVYPFLWASSIINNGLLNISQKKQSYQALEAQNQELQKSYDALQGALIKAHSSIQFAQDTQEILEFKKRFDLSNAMLAKILVKNISPEEHTVILNRGSRDGVKKDMVAIYKLQIVGKVIHVTEYYSKLQLITDKECKVASHANTTGAGGIITGTNEINRCHFDYVSYINPVESEDLIFSSGQGMVFPEGFCLGKISKLITHDKALYHTIEVTPLIDLTTLAYCLLTDQTKITLF